jgi:1-aminocyclopropane-1-carboxylate deaminase/D-cysteine desulfhydrase-like pyridoxal-dependent ACC family enzyme
MEVRTVTSKEGGSRKGLTNGYPPADIHSMGCSVIGPLLLLLYWFTNVASVLKTPLSQMRTSLAPVSIFGRAAFIIRDDMVSTAMGGLRGNKARKFKSLLSNLSERSNILSYGGCQSNALLALSRIASAKASSLHYFTSVISPDIKKNPTGNYKQSILLGAKVKINTS